MQAVALAFRGQEDASIPIQVELQQAVARTFITAQISIAQECREEFLGVQEKKYRGQPDYPQEYRADLLWLDRKVEDLNRALKDDPFTALPNLETQSGLVTNDGESLSNVTAVMLATILSEPDMPDCFAEKIRQSGNGLFERAQAAFTVELQDQKVREAFKVGQLTQINQQLHELQLQQLTVDDFMTVREEIVERLERIEAILLQDSEVTVLESADDIAPFVLPSGRVTDKNQFFWAPEVKATLRRVFETLNSGSSVVLIAEREMGKSSLLWAITQQAEKELQISREAVYLSLQRLQSDEEFYEELCEKLGLPNVRGRQLTRQIEQGRRWLVCIDDVERMSQDGFPRWVREQLRGWAEGSDAPLRLVLAARKPLQQVFPDSFEDGQVSPLAGLCLEENLNVWSEKTIRAYIAERFGETEIQKIIQECKGRPKQVMRLCFEESRRQRK